MALPKSFTRQFDFEKYPNTFWEGDTDKYIVFFFNDKKPDDFFVLWDNYDVGYHYTTDQNINRRNYGKWSIKSNVLVITGSNGDLNFPKDELQRLEQFWIDSTEPTVDNKSEQPKEAPKEQPKPVDTKRTKPEFDWEAWKEQNKPVQPQKPPVDCSEWVTNNLFEEYFKPEFYDKAAQDFVDWYIKKRPSFLNRFVDVCGIDNSGKFKSADVHKNGLVRFMTRVSSESGQLKSLGNTYFEIWLKEYQKTNSDKFKDETQMKESIVKKLKSIKETKSLKESLVNKLNKKKIEKKVNEVKVERNLIKLSESYTFKRDNKFYSELGRIVKNYKNTSNFLTENTDQTFSDAFKFVFSNGEEQIKKETITRLFKSLGIEERTEIANQISEKLTAMETTEIYLNCLKVSSIILSTMITAITSELSSEATGSLEGMVKSVINSSLNSSDNMEKLKYQINNVVCPVLEGYKTRIVDMPKEISNAFTNMI
jgi:hypothetical protein